MQEGTITMTDNTPGKYRGLSDAEVEASRKRDGSNSLTAKKKKSFLSMLASNFSDPIIKILIAALCANLVFSFNHFDWSETIGIVAAIILATVVSTLSERGSEMAFEQLQEESAHISCRAMRNGKIQELNIEELVVGDIVLLEAGERIPADGVIVSGALDVDQSALNGEGKEAHKIPSNEPPSGTADSVNMLLRGSVVTTGEAVMRITSVGEKTAWGLLALEVQEDTRISPLKLRLSKLADTISKIGYAAAVLVALTSLFNAFVLDSINEVGADRSLLWQCIVSKFNFQFIIGEIIRALTLAVTVIVVAVPEGLPMMITVVLSSNMKRMMKDNVLVRKLVGIETAGSLNILFTDKTGTLTEGRLTTCEIALGDGSEITDVGQLKKHGALFERYLISSYFNTSSAISEKRAIGGNATDRALTESIIGHISGKEFSRIQVTDRILFDSARKFSSVTLSTGDCYVKGAPEKIINGCTSYISTDGEVRAFRYKDKLIENWKRMTAEGKRVIALAYKPQTGYRTASVSGESDLCDMTLIGLVAICDRTRREAKKAVSDLKHAGIQVVMITGDNPDTARTIARECGLISAKGNEIVLTGDELRRMGDRQLQDMLPKIAVIARALPTDKSRLVRIAQELDLVVGMTGDGINDAPALKKADVGFAMGSGTEIAKEAGDILITDDNIRSITRAVLYGRTIFKSIRKFIVFQLTMNLCAVGISIIGPFIGIDTPVTVLQMLWINMIMDTLGGLAFAGEPPLDRYMSEKPKRRDEPIINSYMLGQIGFTGVFTVVVSVLFLSLDVSRKYFGYYVNQVYFLTAFFAMFIFLCVLNCFNARTERMNLMKGVSKNRPFVIIITFVLLTQLLMIYFGGEIFRTMPLAAKQLAAATLISFTVIPADLVRKAFLKLTKQKSSL